MSPRRRKQQDPIEQAIEAALDPGSFISYKASWSFVSGVQEVAEEVEKLIVSEPERAAHLYETFIAACHEKAEEIDDSSGSFGMLVGELFCGWIKARQAASADREETVRWLLAWMEDDPYGFCYRLEQDAVKVLDREHLDAFARRVREKFEAAATADGGKKERFPDYARGRWSEVLKTVLAARRDIDAYIALCQETEFKAEDCKAIAEMCRSRGRHDDALAWVERGQEIACLSRMRSSVDHDLADMKRSLLAKLGRAGEALEEAWAQFQGHPSSFTYKELMRYVPANEKKAWHEKAMTASDHGDLGSQIELWMEKKEIERLVARLRRATDDELERLSHYTTEPTARKIERAHPDVAARLYRALGVRIVKAKKSQYYDTALDHLERAKKCYEKAGLPADWEKLVAEVREQHRRKQGFMAGFERIVTGVSRRAKPTFLERAKRRWPKGCKR